MVTIPSGTVAPQTVTIFGTTSGSWNISATSGCGWGDCGACTYLAPLNVSCCPECPGLSTWTIGTREIYTQFSPGALPITGSIKIPTVFTQGNSLASYILSTDKVKVTIYDNSQTLMFTQDNMAMKDISGATLSNQLSLTAPAVNGGVPLPDGQYVIFTEVRTSSDVIYARSVQQLTVAGGGTWSTNTAGRALGASGPGGKYELDYTMCSNITMTPRLDGLFTVSNPITGVSESAVACAFGYDDLILDTISAPGIPIRVSYTCIPPADVTDDSCFDCTEQTILYKFTDDLPLFNDHFLYCL